MTNEFIHYEKISRETWQSLHRKTTPPLTEEELDSIKSFNDQISLQDVTDIYLPLAHLIQIYKRSKEDLAFSKGIFLQRESKISHLLSEFQVVSLLANQLLADSYKFCFPVFFQKQVLN